MKKTYTTGEVASFCGVHFRTVIRWIERGLLKAFKLPGRGDNRIVSADLVAFLKENGIPIPPELQSGKPHVLIIDDDPLMARAIERILVRAGYKTSVALDGFVGGVLLGTLNPDVVTLDLKMPGVHGRDVLRFIRETETLKDKKVLVISAMPKKELTAAVEAGADGFLEKPFENEALVQKITELGLEPDAM